MKKKIIIVGVLSASALFAPTTQVFSATNKYIKVVHGDKKTETFKVYGNCGMCEKTIEGSLKNVKGVEKADWNKETKMMDVTFDSEVITLKEIKQKIADMGYDTDEVKATDKVYNGLPGCCQYDRPDDSKQDDHNHQH